MDDDYDDLVAFLLDRLAEDEAAARALATGVDLAPFESVQQASDHRARHGPVRVLREVAAKRAMVEFWQDGRAALEVGVPCRGLDVATAMIVAQAAVFADHAAFDPSWLGDPPAAAASGGDVVPFRGRS